ncbi:unnamed protein product [Fraxinus pennsylvanica]|uniref:RNase H type-1 domain-containing protein n=1 Tax=Fraxinus pennsylvanica TaxID=56036 RepID=A0AAD2E6W7_9LAMI|nr:unnamed protein product [Fraxinus pennsylvanica]
MQSKTKPYSLKSTVWHNALPKRSSVVIWKALSGSLSFDDRVRQIGVAMASRCNCCTTGHEEDSNHVLSAGDFADEVWRRLSLALSVRWRTRQSWWDRIKFGGKSYEILSTRMLTMIYPMFSNLKHLATNVKKTRVLTREEEKFLTDMGIPCVVRILSPVHLVTWKKPMLGRAKLNVDGSSLGNPSQACGGGVICNDKGMVLAAFATNFGIASNNEAELRALLEGLKLCQHIGVFHVDVECDSKIVVEWMLKRKCTVWYLWDFWEELLNLMNLFEIQVSHQFQEGNQVADFLAKMGAHGVTQRFSIGLPMYARGLARLDRIGVPYIRK